MNIFLVQCVLKCIFSYFACRPLLIYILRYLFPRIYPIVICYSISHYYHAALFISLRSINSDDFITKQYDCIFPFCHLLCVRFNHFVTYPPCRSIPIRLFMRIFLVVLNFLLCLTYPIRGMGVGARGWGEGWEGKYFNLFFKLYRNNGR